MESFFQKHKIFSEHQSGFQKGKCTSTTINRFLKYVVDQLDNTSSLIAFFCDLSKAFDSVNHDILLQKLEYYGVRGIALNVLKDYLSNRNQCVELKIESSDEISIRSDYKKVTCGVLQGSILGPFLLLVFINDLPSTLPDVEIFCDDSTIIVNPSIGYSLKDKAERIFDNG